MRFSASRIRLSLALLAITGAAAAELPPIFITAGRVAEPTEKTLYSTSTVTREQIQQRQPHDAAEILERLPGIQIGRNGGPGQATSAFIRGAASDHTLLLIDGVPVNSGTVGNPALQHLLPTQIQRVEVVRGPASTLYGSSAIGGVVQIFTRDEAPGTRARLTVGAGSEGTTTLAGSLAHGAEQAFVNLSFSRLVTDGYPVRPSLLSIDRGYENRSVTAAVGGRVGPIGVEAGYLASEGLVEYIDFFGSPVDQDTANSVARLAFTYQPRVAWRSRLLLGRARDEIDENQSDDFAETRRDFIDWQNTFNIDDRQTLVAGLSAYRTDTDLLSFGSGYDERIRSVEYYLQDTIEFGDTRLQFGGRAIDNDQYGNHATWNISIGHRLDAATRLHANIGTAFRAPSANDLYGFGGNPDFDPETSVSAEIGVRHRLTRSDTLQLTGFRTEIDDLIETDPITFVTEQTEKARIAGIEAGYAHQSADWSWSLDYTHMDPRNLDVDQTLARRARNTVNAALGYQQDRWWGEASLRYQSERRDSRFSDTILGAYTTLGLVAGYRFSPSLSVQGRVRNLFDEDYELSAGYPAQGRFISAELRYNHR